MAATGAARSPNSSRAATPTLWWPYTSRTCRSGISCKSPTTRPRLKWLLLSRWKNLTQPHRGELNQLFQMNRRVFKAYLLKENLERLWQYTYPGAMINYLQRWMDQLRWQRLQPFEELAVTLLKHLDGIANYCRTKVRMGVVEAVNANIRMLINRGRGYKNLRCEARTGSE